MRDPWKVLALLLALVLGLVILLRAPAASTPSEAAVTSLEERDAPAANAPGRSMLRSQAGDPTSANATTDAKVDLLVRLVDPSGQVLDGSCQLRLQNRSTLWSRPGPGLTVVYDVEPGLVSLTSYVRGYYRHEEELWIPATLAEQAHEVVMEPSARIPVKFLTPDGTPLSSAIRERFKYADLESCMPYLYASKDAGPPSLPMNTGIEYSSQHAHWDGRGFLGDPADPDGTLSLWSRPPLMLHLMVRHRVIGSHALEGVVDRLEIVVDPAVVTGELGTVKARVLNGTTGAPVAGGTLMLSGGRSGQGLLRVSEDGDYERAGLAAGIYQLQGFFREEGGVDFQVILNPGETLDLGEIRTALPGTLAVRLLTSNQEPIPGATGLLWANQRTPRLVGTYLSTLESDPGGLVALERILPGQYTVTLGPPLESGLAVTALRCTVPGSESVSIEARPGALVTLTGGDDDPLRHRVWLLAEGYAPAASWSYYALPATVRLATGNHVWLLVDPGGQEVRRGVIEVKDAASELRVELRLP